MAMSFWLQRPPDDWREAARRRGDEEARLSHRSVAESIAGPSASDAATTAPAASSISAAARRSFIVGRGRSMQAHRSVPIGWFV